MLKSSIMQQLQPRQHRCTEYAILTSSHKRVPVFEMQEFPAVPFPFVTLNWLKMVF